MNICFIESTHYKLMKTYRLPSVCPKQCAKDR